LKTRRGRPEVASVRRTVRIPADLDARLVKLAKSLNSSVSKLICRMAEDRLDTVDWHFGPTHNPKPELLDKPRSPRWEVLGLPEPPPVDPTPIRGAKTPHKPVRPRYPKAD
jgi:hypothetical protein